MRVYNYLPADFALEDIEKRRIKVSEIEQLNDPFELSCAYQKDRRIRIGLQGYKKQMSARYGLLCFSKSWHNPVLWSHYAEKHRGICLGFEIDANRIEAIRYANERPNLPIPPTLEDAKQLLFVKYSGWKYEQEWRGWIKIDERDVATGFYFYPFDGIVQLREVIVGPLSGISKTRIVQALKGYPGEVAVIKARQVDFKFDGRQIRGLEQNPDTKSRWAAMARVGKKVMQFLVEGRYVANVLDGKVTQYG